MCLAIQATRQLQPGDIWLAIVLGHFTRCVLTVARFRQGISVEPVGSMVGDMAGFAKGLREKGRRFPVVLDDEDPHGCPL
jgi:hypothetical protein